MFVTLFYGTLDTKTGEIQYVNAGHNPPYILKANGSVEVLPNSTNICLGVIEDYQYKGETLKLEKGDCIVTFTDGVTEACSPSEELYGEARKLIAGQNAAEAAGETEYTIAFDKEEFSCFRKLAAE